MGNLHKLFLTIVAGSSLFLFNKKTLFDHESLSIVNLEEDVQLVDTTQ